MTVHISYHVKKINKFLQKWNSAAAVAVAVAAAQLVLTDQRYWSSIKKEEKSGSVYVLEQKRNINEDQF